MQPVPRPEPAPPPSSSPPTGLSTADARSRLDEHGPNELERRQRTPVWRLLIGQFTSPLVLILLGGAGISAALQHLVDAIAIVAIVSINAVVGFVQEHRAEQAVLALRSLTAARAKVIRDGRLQEIVAGEVVPGDLLVLEPGDVVAADARLSEAHELSTIEAALTGESMPVSKDPTPVSDDTPLAERSDRVFMGTAVATGTGRAVVFATGMRTEMGNIAHLLDRARDDATPLQKRLAALGRVLLFVCLGFVSLIAVVGILQGQTWLEVMMTSVSLAVAAVPEGLPAVVTVALAVGVRRMSARNVLIRRLSAVETLGSATVICTDKTGTLTTGIMTVRDTWARDDDDLLRAAAACCDAEIDDDGQGTGDPTEIAILRAAAERGFHRADIEREAPRLQERPFDAERRLMSVLRSSSARPGQPGEGARLYVKGALESVLPISIDPPAEIQAIADEMAGRGLRVLAVAVGSSPAEENLEFLGLIGIADAPRPEAIDAIAQAHRAGIKVVMITGDHPLTAHAIAREMGIVTAQFKAEDVVFARKTAADKTDIVRSFAARGEIVAMTGDGVNDAPSIKEAHIGIAMGKTATEVTREASEMILTDDNLGSVVEAIREGRIIYANIRKTVVYLLSGNGAELVFMLVAAAIGLPMPLTPLQLLWVNMMTEPLPGLALAVDPAAGDVLDRPPRRPDEPILNRQAWLGIGAVAVIHTIVTLGVFAWALPIHGLEVARTLAFSSFVFGVLFRAFSARHAHRIFWEVGALGNLRLLAVVLLCVGLQVGIHALPWTQELFAVEALDLEWLLLSLGLGLVPVTCVELFKLLRRGVLALRS